jgi:ornithine cyclodeaminase/alanine dehydrogenase-like protein (mu-crystallin family)
MRDAFIQLSSSRAIVPARMSMEVAPESGRALLMPAYLPDSHRTSIKIVSVNEENPARGLPLIHAVVIVLDASTGRLLALLDGEYLTALRTGAASGLATKLLAREDSRSLAIFGAGAQARTQLEAVCCVREIKRISVFDLEQERADNFIASLREDVSTSIEFTQDAKSLQDADIVCTATTSQTPVFQHEDLRPGTHINAIGCYQPHTQEIPGATVAAAKVVLGQRDGCLAEAGDLIQPIEQGLISEGHIYGELGEIATGEKPGRETADEITLFKSVGNAVQDLAAASRVLENADKLGLGTEVNL